jgi:hypothetical protein
MFPSRLVNARTLTPDWPYPGVSDAVLMSSRDNKCFDRTFKEAWVRPDPDNWHERSVYIMRGILDTGPNGLSLYMSDHWRLPSNSIRRLSLRKDGFASLQAGYDSGEAVTRPLVFVGNELRLNLSTSAVGSVRVEVQGEDGQPLPGLALADCEEIYHDEIARSVRLRFAPCDADLYTFRFAGV